MIILWHLHVCQVINSFVFPAMMRRCLTHSHALASWDQRCRKHFEDVPSLSLFLSAPSSMPRYAPRPVPHALPSCSHSLRCLRVTLHDSYMKKLLFIHPGLPLRELGSVVCITSAAVSSQMQAVFTLTLGPLEVKRVDSASIASYTLMW